MTLGDGASLIAAVIAFVALYRTRKKAEVERKYNDIASKLALLQIELLEREREAQSAVRLIAYFYRDHVGTYRIALKNTGSAPAYNVDLDVLNPRDGRSVVLDSDRASKLPVRVMHPENEVYLMAPLHLGLPSQFDARVSWEDDQGRRKVDTQVVSLP